MEDKCGGFAKEIDHAWRASPRSSGTIAGTGTLPLAPPAILATLIYIFVTGLATFEIPAVIGQSSKIANGTD